MRFNNYIGYFFRNKAISKSTGIALIILIVGLILTVVATIFTGYEDEVNGKKEFALICKEIDISISARLHAHAQLLRSGSAFFSASDTITRKEWHDFMENSKVYKNLPGIQGVGFAMIIPKNQLQKHISQIRNEGFPDYTIKPAGERNDYTSIIYIEPFTDRNLRAFGYDMFSQPIRRKAMELSRDSDIAVLSGKVKLVQEIDRKVQIGILMYVPVYRIGKPVNTVDQRRAAIKGWVYSPYRMNDLMQGMLGRWDLNREDRIHLQVYEDSLSENSILYNSQVNDTLSNDDSPSRTISMPIEFSGKKWILHFTKNYQQSTYNSKVIILFTGGLLISLLLFALSFSLFNTRIRAKELAGLLTLELFEGEERFKILLNSTAEAIYGIDLLGNCTFSNTACLQILGYNSHSHLIGENMHTRIHHSHADGSSFDVHECLIYKAFHEGKGTHVDNEVFWRADGTFFSAEYWSVPVFINGKIEGAVVTFFDITERLQSVEKIKEARYEAEKANLAKSEFLSRMSHELRTPMNAILGFAQLLEMGELNKSQMKGVGHILSSGKHLLDLINEVLDISRIESGKVSLLLEPVALDDIIQEMTDTIQPLIYARQLSLELVRCSDISLFVKSDRQRLKQVLLNLLNNAIKYNEANGSVKIKTEIIHNAGMNPDSIRISITDSGSGISTENIQKLFKPFERIGAEKTATEGTGLGLTVVKKLMDAMDGKIGIDSIKGEGSTFWIELPRCENQLKPVEKTLLLPGSDLTGISGTILYIEDNTSNTELVEQILINQRKGIRLITSMIGGDAVHLAIKFKPDLILLDLNLPDLHGSEVIKLLQSELKTKDIPVVVISADAMPHQMELMIKEGAKDYLTKPLDLNVFLKVVDKFNIRLDT